MRVKPERGRTTRDRLRVRFAAFLSACVAAGAAAAQPISAQDLVNAAAQSDAYEIAASQLILTQSGDQAVRSIAQQMIDDRRRMRPAPLERRRPDAHQDQQAVGKR
jgi:hypothetical protein